MDEITKTSTLDSGIESPNHDTGRFGKVFLRWKWLPMLGAAIGALVGVAYFAQLPNQYKATALVKVVTDNKDSNSEHDLAVFRSDAVLRNAAKQIELSKNRTIDGKSAEEIVGMMQDPTRRMLEVRLGSNDVNSKVVNVSVIAKDSKLSAEMVTAIVNSYETYATEKFGSTVTRLESPIIGSFTGPYWTTYFWIGATLGLIAFSVIVISGTPEFLTRKLKRRTTLAGSVKSDSYQFNRANLTRAPLT